MFIRLVKTSVLFALVFWYANCNAYVITYNAGPAWYAPFGKKTLNLDNDTSNVYTITNAPRAILNNELFFGKELNLKSNFDAQIGISLNHNSNAKISGDIWQDASSEFNNFTYDYYISHSALTLKGKLLFTKYSTAPYIALSLGVASNRSFAFNQVVKISEAVTAYSFNPKSVASFTYSVEAGVQKKLNNNWALGIAYEFADLGKSKLGPAFAQYNNAVPYLNYLYINQLQFNVSYFFNE